MPVSLGLIGCLAALSHSPDDLELEVTTRVEAFLRRTDAPGACVSLVKDGEVVFVGAFGERHRSRSLPVTTETLFGIGSVSKIYTATLAQLLVESGECDLDDLLQDWLVEEVEVPGEITLRHLLSHTSGLPRSSPTRRNLAIEGPINPGIALPMSRAQLIDGLRQAELEAEPGARWDYSNFGMSLAGHALESVAEQTYEELLRERLLEPLGLEQTWLTLTPERQERFAAHYWPADIARQERPPWVFGEVVAAGGIMATIGDVTRFLRYHLGVVEGPSPEALGRMRVPIIEADMGPNAQQCLGWFRHELPGDPNPTTLFAHGGEVDGHSADLVMVPRSKSGLVALVNLGGVAAAELREELIHLVLANDAP